MTCAFPDLAILTPIEPAVTGNGLAMRADLMLTAAAADYRVSVLVVPVAGGTPAVPTTASRTGRPARALPPAGRADVAAGLAALLSRPQWRDRLARSAPLPPVATLAPPTLAAAAEALLDVPPGTPVHAARAYLAPLAVALAERLRSRWVTLDLDDDDEAFERAAGRAEVAAAYGRLISAYGPVVQRVALAAAAEADAIAARHGLLATVLPNAVDLTTWRSARPAPDGAAERVVRPPEVPVPAPVVLMVASLSYPPNAAAATVLARQILPRVRSLTGSPARLILAGAIGAAGPEIRALGREPGVTLAGYVPDVRPLYAAADVVVAPLASGAGTRIKLLEAFGAGVPVVTTRLGAAGLDVTAGEHLLLAETPEQVAQAVASLWRDGRLGARLAANAASLVRERYSYEAVIPQIRAFFAAAEAGAGAGAPGQETAAPGRAHLVAKRPERAGAPRSPAARAGRRTWGPAPAGRPPVDGSSQYWLSFSLTLAPLTRLCAAPRP